MSDAEVISDQRKIITIFSTLKFTNLNTQKIHPWQVDSEHLRYLPIPSEAEEREKKNQKQAGKPRW